MKKNIFQYNDLIFKWKHLIILIFFVLLISTFSFELLEKITYTFRYPILERMSIDMTIISIGINPSDDPKSKRSKIIEIINKLTSLNVKVIALDIEFNGDNTPELEDIQEAINNAQNNGTNVILGVFSEKKVGKDVLSIPDNILYSSNNLLGHLHSAQNLWHNMWELPIYGIFGNLTGKKENSKQSISISPLAEIIVRNYNDNFFNLETHHNIYPILPSKKLSDEIKAANLLSNKYDNRKIHDIVFISFFTDDDIHNFYGINKKIAGVYAHTFLVNQFITGKEIFISDWLNLLICFLCACIPIFLFLFFKNKKLAFYLVFIPSVLLVFFCWILAKKYFLVIEMIRPLIILFFFTILCKNMIENKTYAYEKRFINNKKQNNQILNEVNSKVSIDNEKKHNAKFIFISYAREDNKGNDSSKHYLDRLLQHIKPFQKQGEIKGWADSSIEIGENLNKEIHSALKKANHAILMISPSFLASDYIRYKELPVILDKAKNKKLKIIPIIVSPCAVKKAKFKYPDPKNGPNLCNLGNMVAINFNKNPLNKMSVAEVDSIFKNIIEKIL